jgi:hypothetical protein
LHLLVLLLLQADAQVLVLAQAVYCQQMLDDMQLLLLLLQADAQALV